MFSETDRFRQVKRLPKKGTIAISALASPVEEKDLNRGVSYLEKFGYRVEVGKSCYSATDYLAGSDALRANEFMSFIEDSRIDAIISARGGFGSMRMLKLLDFDLISQQEKLFIGFSDITALQWAIYAQTGLPAISAGMPATDMARDEMNADFEAAFWSLLEDGQIDIAINHQQEQDQIIQGFGLPGTVSVAAKLLGSEYFPDTTGAILLLEDVNEMKHKVEGYLQQFVLSNVFDKAAAVALGAFTEPENEEYPVVPDIDTLFKRVFRGVRIPVFQGLDYGHIKNKIALPLGTPLSLSLGAETRLKSTANIYKD